MLHCITHLSDPLCSLIADDPVRPNIPIEFRVGAWSNIFVLLDDYGKPTAVVCARYCDQIPRSVVELTQQPVVGSVAVFYTIWSYAPGAGRKLIVAARDWLIKHKASVEQFVTLSPPTEMARVFHLRNGAQVFSVNSDTVNYIYQ
jgi:hypothetical protein